jgi:hypothetical protein
MSHAQEAKSSQEDSSETESEGRGQKDRQDQKAPSGRPKGGSQKEGPGAEVRANVRDPVQYTWLEPAVALFSANLEPQRTASGYRCSARIQGAKLFRTRCR